MAIKLEKQAGAIVDSKGRVLDGGNLLIKKLQSDHIKPVIVDSNGNEKVMVWDVRNLVGQNDNEKPKNAFKRSNSYDKLVKQNNISILDSEEHDESSYESESDDEEEVGIMMWDDDQQIGGDESQSEVQIFPNVLNEQRNSVFSKDGLNVSYQRLQYLSRDWTSTHATEVNKSIQFMSLQGNNAITKLIVPRLDEEEERLQTVAEQQRIMMEKFGQSLIIQTQTKQFNRKQTMQSLKFDPKGLKFAKEIELEPVQLVSTTSSIDIPKSDKVDHRDKPEHSHLIAAMSGNRISDDQIAYENNSQQKNRLIKIKEKRAKTEVKRAPKSGRGANLATITNVADLVDVWADLQTEL